MHIHARRGQSWTGNVLCTASSVMLNRSRKSPARPVDETSLSAARSRRPNTRLTKKKSSPLFKRRRFGTIIWPETEGARSTSTGLRPTACSARKLDDLAIRNIKSIRRYQGRAGRECYFSLGECYRNIHRDFECSYKSQKVLTEYGDSDRPGPAAFATRGDGVTDKDLRHGAPFLSFRGQIEGVGRRDFGALFRSASALKCRQER